MSKRVKNKKNAFSTLTLCAMLIITSIGTAAEQQDKPLTGAIATVAFRGDGAVDTFKPGVKLFTDRDYTLAEAPEWLTGEKFWCGSINNLNLRVINGGVLTILTPDPEIEGAASQAKALERNGFIRITPPELFHLFGKGAINKVRIYQKMIEADTRLILGKWAVAIAFDHTEDADAFPVETETLYNNIILPVDTWDRTDMSAFGNEPQPVPYLDHPPSLIPIGIGRQLFVDDFLIESTNLRRTWHKAVKDERNPVMNPETDLERGVNSGNAPMAAPFSGGVWYDGIDQLFKMWYCAGWFDGTAYAFSRDGIDWERPELKVEPGTNRIIPRKGVRDSCAVVMDPHAEETDNMRFKMLVWSRPQGGELFVSRDGICWSDPVRWASTGDRSTIFYNPFRRQWVYSIRAGWSARSREYSESSDFLGGADLANRVKWLRADNLDLPDTHWFYAFPEREPERGGDKPALYNFDAVAYESLMLGAFTIHLGPANNFCAAEGVPKVTEIHLGFSRDGFHWSRPIDRTPFIPAGREAGTWDRAYLHSNAALCLVMGDELWFYYTGFAGDPKRKGLPGNANGYYANAATGIARLRRDGFASMDADAKFGELTTRPLVFERGQHLFVNADSSAGELRVELLDAAGKTIPGFESGACKPFSGDSTKQIITWNGNKSLETLHNKPVRLRFHLRNGSLYSFWVSNEHGASNGWLAGGAPGHTTLRDNW